MRLKGDEEYTKKEFPIVQTALGATGLALLIILVVFLTNADRRPAGTADRVQKQESMEKAEAGQDQETEVVKTRKRRAQDLNFWGMYPENEDDTTVKKQEFKEDPVYTKPQVTGKEETKAEKTDKTEKEEKKEDDPATDGKHVQVMMDDGTEEWLTINRSLPMNSYEATGFQKEAGFLKYYRDGRNVTYTGVVLDKYSGKVDFEALKKSGVSFVMIRVGGRGYNTGVITEDEQFESNMQAATEAGINIGVYFSSQAVTPEEAAEEADYMMQKAAPYKISYPMAVKMETIRNDTSRTESLSKNDRTTVLRIFMEALSGSTYKPMLMGDKNFLITKVDLAALSGYGIWLYKTGDIPEYPYQFSMWQYTDKGEINGIENDAGVLLSFIDYSAR